MALDLVRKPDLLSEAEARVQAIVARADGTLALKNEDAV
jgi:hypothetical protein